MSAHTRTLTANSKRPRRECTSSIEFGDDFGDNTTTFHCDLLSGHKGRHTEEGVLYDNRICVTWAPQEEKP